MELHCNVSKTEWNCEHCALLHTHNISSNKQVWIWIVDTFKTAEFHSLLSLNKEILKKTMTSTYLWNQLSTNVSKCPYWQHNDCCLHTQPKWFLFNCKININKSRKCEETITYLNTEVSSIYVVTEEEIPCVTGWSPHFKQLHKVKELSMDITTYCQKTNTLLLHNINNKAYS